MENYTKDACGPAPSLNLTGVAYPPAQVPAGGPVAAPSSPDFEHTVLCDPNTNDRVFVTTAYDPTTGVPTVTAANLDGSPYGGPIADLVACGGGSVESDGQPYCLNGDNFTQWVLKDNGEPTGDVIWTDATGAVVAPVVGAVVGVCPTGKTVGFDVVHGRDTVTGDQIERRYVLLDHGTTEITDYINGVPQLTQSGNFTENAAQVSVQEQTWFATNLGNGIGDPEHGRVSELTRVARYEDGVLQPYQYVNKLGTDVTAIVTVAPWDLSVAQQRTITGNGDIAGLTDTAQAITWASAVSTYAEVYINAEDGNVIWDVNGAVPTANFSEDENGGTTIRLLDRDEMDAFRIAARVAGEDANLSWTEWNIAPDED